MPPPRSTVEFYATQRQLAVETLIAARAAWAQMNPAAFDASWQAIGPQIELLLAMAQQQAATAGANYVPIVLAELGIMAPSVAPVLPAALAGVASSGFPLADVLYEVVIDTKTRVGQGATARQALRGARSLLDGIVTTQVADAGRVATGVSITARPQVAGYVRMLNPPSCSRCVVLAGRFYRWNRGFERHPRCDCRHIPTQEDMADDLRTDPRKYFDSLTLEQQDAAFGKAGAQAIRDGADIGKVVNSRSGVYVAGDRILTHSGIKDRHGGVRLMPEQIYRDAVDRADAIRLLKRFGYLL